LPQDEITIARQLKERGYATACVGKWHLGHLPPFLPMKHGFDSYFGIPYSNDMRIDPDAQLAGDIKLRDNVSVESIRDEPLKGGNAPLMRGEEVIEYPADQRALTERYTDEAIRFIETNKERPFFLYLPHTMPHTPLHIAEEHAGKSKRGLYGDVVEELDRNVGRLLQKLRDSKLDQNTLVLFTSDNGPWLAQRGNGGSAGLLRGGKGATWEGGMREPAIAWWPGKIKAGAVTAELGSTLDVFPTLSALAGVPLPNDRPLDGYDLSGLILENKPSPRSEMFFYRGTYLMAVRKGPWKAHLITQNAYGKDLARVEHNPPELYQLEHDPGERYNVAEQHPEVLAKIAKLIEQHKANLKPVPSRLESRITRTVGEKP
jgi:arylsulfatase A